MQFEVSKDRVLNNPNFQIVSDVPTQLPEPIQHETFTLQSVNFPVSTNNVLAPKIKQGNYGELYQFSPLVYALLDHPHLVKTMYAFVELVSSRAQINTRSCWAHFEPKKILAHLNKISDDSDTWFTDIIYALRTAKSESAKSTVSRSQKQIPTVTYFEMLSAYDYHRLTMLDEEVYKRVAQKKDDLSRDPRFHMTCERIFEIVLNDSLLGVVRDTFDAIIDNNPHAHTKIGQLVKEKLDIWELIEDEKCRPKFAGFVAEMHTKLHSKLKSVKFSKSINEKCKIFGLCVELISPVRLPGSSRLEFQEKAYKKLTNE